MFEGREITIISGGQTGADRAALDFAIDHGRPHGGWCPRGRLAEDGSISPRYELRETPSRRYSQRTEWNVRDSEATVAFTIGAEVSGGTSLTLACARSLGKPWLHLSREWLAAMHGERNVVAAAAEELAVFIAEHDVHALNVAGPRASQQPEIAGFVRSVLMSALV